MGKTAIEWAEHSWNPVRARNRATGRVGHFCTHASDGCRHCYAETWQKRLGNPVRFAAQDAAKVEVFLDARALGEPLRRRIPTDYFVCSMTDLFGEFVADDMIDRVFAVAALCPQHTLIVLTKRSARMRNYLSAEARPNMVARACVDLWIEGRVKPGDDWPVQSIRDPRDPDNPSEIILRNWPLPNVIAMVSIEDQKNADQRIPDLLATPAALRGVSAEPLLGPVRLDSLCEDGWSATDALRPYTVAQAKEDWGEGFEIDCGMAADRPALDWVIAGGESGNGARPVHPDWLRSLRDQCAAADVPFLFKQWGAWTPGENVVRHTGTVRTATWFDNRWLYDSENLAWEHGHVDDQPDLYRVGKKEAGRTLDAVTHDARPGR